MKIIYFIVAFLFFPLSIFSQNSDVIIEGQIIGYKFGRTVHCSIKNYYGGGWNTTIVPDSLGRFTMRKNINEIEFFTLTYDQDSIFHPCRLILEPGKHYYFVSKGRNIEDYKNPYSPDIYSISTGKDKNAPFYKYDRGETYYNLIDNGTMGALYHDSWNLMNPDSLIMILNKRISDQVSIFQKLQLSGEIDQSIYEIAKLNIEYTNAYRLAQTISDTWGPIKEFKINDTVLENKLLKIYPEIFELYPVNKEVKLEDHYCFDRYVNLYLWYLADCKTGRFNPQIRRNVQNIEPLLDSKDYLDDLAYKIYNQISTMNYMINYGLKAEEYGKKLLKEQPDFNKNDNDYINNVIMPNLENFKRISKERIPENIIILDDNDSINTYDKMCKILSDKACILDLWGTWCHSCLYQFQFQDSLKNFLKFNDIKKVYIAFEYDTSRVRWKTFVKAYKLEGYHFIANSKFKTDLEKYIGKITKFPTYIILNKNGKVVESDAYYPSQSNQLINQLKQKLDL